MIGICFTNHDLGLKLFVWLLSSSAYMHVCFVYMCVCFVYMRIHRRVCARVSRGKSQLFDS